MFPCYSYGIFFIILVPDDIGTHSNGENIGEAEAVVLLDGDVTSCLTPFSRSDLRRRDVAFAGFGLKRRRRMFFGVITDLGCREPHTILVSSNGTRVGNGNSCFQMTQCGLLRENPTRNGLSICTFECRCLGLCAGIILRQQFLPWLKAGNPSEYRLCEVRIAWNKQVRRFDVIITCL